MISEHVIEAANAFLKVAPVAIMDDVYNCAHSYLCDGIDALELALKKQASADIDRDRIAAMVESVHQAIVKRLDRNLDKMELYTLANILTVSEDLCPDLQELNKIEFSQNDTDLNCEEAGADRQRLLVLSQIRLARRLNQHLKRELALFDKERPRVTELMETSDRFIKEISLVQDSVMNVDLKARQYRDSVLSLQNSIGSHLNEEPESDNLIAPQIQLKSVAKFTEYCLDLDS